MIGIVGLGLIGGSLGMALRKAGRKVIGYEINKETRQKALSLGAVDKIADNLVEVAKECQIIILATPILEIKGILERLSPNLQKGTILTDTASTKVQVMSWASEALPTGVEFIGGHPMAGKERWGIEAATPELFIRAPYCLVPSAITSPQARSQIVSIVEAIGAHPLFLTAEEHDFYVAGISHLPLILSALLVNTTGKEKEWEEISKLASTGFRDVSRLASGNPIMSRDIGLTNRENILFWLKKLEEEIQSFKGVLNDGEKLRDWFNRAYEYRKDWLESRA